jgi:hypothetical protein
MRASGSSSRFLAGVTVAVLAAIGLTSAHAQQQQNPPAPTQQQSNPVDQLLQKYTNAGAELSNAVETLALTDPSTFKALLGLIANATDPQKAAIGTGLAQATKVEVLTNQALATDWQTQLAAITDPTFKVATTDAFGDVQLGSVGGGSVGAAGSGLGGPGNAPGGTGGGPPANIQSNPINTQTTSFTSSISGANTLSNSVSP